MYLLCMCIYSENLQCAIIDCICHHSHPSLSVGMSTKIDVLKDKVLVSASATSINLSDTSSTQSPAQCGSYRQVVSTLNDSETLSTLQLTLYIEEGRNPLAPIGKLQANIAQLQLYVPVPFIVQTVVSNNIINVEYKF